MLLLEMKRAPYSETRGVELMNAAVGNWIERALSVLGSIPGASEAVTQERARWAAFRDLETLEVVVFGAYDAGKSSLLKRLLVDWDARVPEWLTVSGRRETFEAKRVETKHIGLIDTPGLGSGNSEHDDSTLAAMRLADAYLWVLPPQLVTTGKERFLEVLFGEIGIADSTIAVIARIDEAGIDPGDNETGFSELCDRKKEELSSIVIEASSSRQLQSVHCVVADPYQMVGNMRQPDREMYDIGRSWDGVDNLIQALLGLLERRRDLRPLAGIRFVYLLLSDGRDELGRLADELALSKEGLDNEVDRHAIYEQRLDALQRQVRAELHRRIDDALLSVSRSGDETGADSIRNLEKTLAKVIDEWAEGSFADYRRLAGELELEAQERMTGPSMEGFRRLAEEAEEREAKGKEPKIDPVKIGRKAVAFGPALRKAFEKYAAAELGVSLKVAADRLQKLESSGETVEAFIKSHGRRAAFRGAEHAKKASQFVQWANVLDAVGPLVEQLGGALLEVAGEVMSAKRADERAHQRLELRGRLRAEAEKLEKTAGVDFDSTCDGLRQWLSERLSAIESGRKGLSEQLDSLKQAATSLEELIEAGPAGP